MEHSEDGPQQCRKYGTKVALFGTTCPFKKIDEKLRRKMVWEAATRHSNIEIAAWIFGK